MACFLLWTNSFYSNIIWIMGHISFMDFVMSVHTFSLTSAKVFPTTVCFWSCCSSFLSCSVTFFSLERLVWKEILSSYRFSTFFLSLLISVSCRFIFSMDLARSVVFSWDVTGISDGTVVTVVVLALEIGMELNGMTSIGFICSFSFNNISISSSISLSCAFCSMSNFSILSFSPSFSAISFTYESYVCGSFSCFLKEAMSSFFFFIIFSVALKFKGS
jgi:hypothetical protein